MRAVKSIFKSETRSEKVKAHVLYSFLIKGGSALVSFIMVPLLYDILDKERYGIWLTLSTMFMWFSHFDIGLGNGLRNKLTEALANKKYVLAKKYVSTSYFILSVIFILLDLIFLFINKYFNWNKILNTSLISSHELEQLTSVVFSLFAFRFIFQLIGVIYISTLKPAVNNALIALGSFLSMVFIVLLTYFIVEINLLELGIILVGIPLLVLIIANLYSFKYKFKKFSPSLKFIRLREVKSLLNLGLKFFFIQIFAIILFSTSSILIAQLFGPSEVTVYNSAFQYFSIPIMLYGIVTSPLWSATTDAWTQQDFPWMKRTLKVYNRISLIFIAGILFMLVLSPYFFQLWIGDRFEIPFKLSFFMALYAIVNVCLSPFSTFINGIGKLRLTMILCSVTGVIYIPLAILFGHLFGNSIGVILALVIVSSTGLFYQPLQVIKLLRRTASGIWNK